MKKYLFFIFVGFFISLTSCGILKNPEKGSYEWSKKYSGSSMARNRSASCGIKKTKTPSWAKVKYTSPKKSNKKKK